VPQTTVVGSWRAPLFCSAAAQTTPTSQQSGVNTVLWHKHDVDTCVAAGVAACCWCCCLLLRAAACCCLLLLLLLPDQGTNLATPVGILPWPWLQGPNWLHPANRSGVLEPSSSQRLAAELHNRLRWPCPMRLLEMSPSALPPLRTSPPLQLLHCRGDKAQRTVARGAAVDA
jgi:hypothetical protein